MANAVKDKVAVVTGAGRGVGRGIAIALAAEGARVVVNDLGVALNGAAPSSSPADEVVREIKKKSGVAIANYDNVATMQGGERIIKAAVDNFGRIDILVTVAGILRDRMIFNMTEEEWDAVIAVHLKGTFTCAKYASILMKQQRSGRIITISSQTGLEGNSGQANYGAAKSGIGGFTKVAARDLGRYGITVNCVVPRAATRMTLTGDYARAGDLRATRGVLRAGIPQPPIEGLDPDDIAPVVVYLASDDAANVNGQFFFVYGDTISLLSQPRAIKSIFKVDRWSVDELVNIIPSTLAKGLVNPAPPVPPA
ncbi:MAG: SDR family oxidoreductase [Chloroflexi bacterium]|nr:SDR family oxidoreductase [Chloroflexota bacterium]